MNLTRRSFFTGLLAAPAVIAYGKLMPVKAQPLYIPPKPIWPTRMVPASEWTKNYPSPYNNNIYDPNTIQKEISRVIESHIFEPNDQFTRSSIQKHIASYMNVIKHSSGIHDYKVVCDSTNNPDSVRLNADIYIRPTISEAYTRISAVVTPNFLDLDIFKTL